MEQRQELNVEGKPSLVKKAVHRKPPVVKQTKTSMYRLVKANPLLLLKDDKDDTTNDFGLNKMKLLKSLLLPTSSYVTDNKSIVNMEPAINSKASIKNSKNDQKPTLTRTTSVRVKPTSYTSNVQLKRTNSIKVQPSTSSNLVRLTQHKNMPTTHTKPTVAKQTSIRGQIANGAKRRSLSAEHYDRKKRTHKTAPEQIMERSENTQSLNDVVKPSTLTIPISPIAEEHRRVTFKTPTANNRRSIHMSFLTPTPMARPYSSTPRPNGNDMQHRLEEWLKQHKKPLESYKHLKCFGLRHSHYFVRRNEENKENVEDANMTRSASYENLKIVPEDSAICRTPIPSDTSVSNQSEMQAVAKDALKDLHKLILDGYHPEHCEAWLGMIRHKYQNLQEEPQYWECRAAIEQTRGNITSAVECLRTAIVQGAEVKTVDRSLEQLLQKFSLLNISTSEPDKDDRTKKDRARIVLDARSVFKSSIIQFAVQERNLKKKTKEEETSAQTFIATPVRRSTRVSRSRYALTPGVKICNTLNELEDTVRDNINFHGNNALNVRFAY